MTRPSYRAELKANESLNEKPFIVTVSVCRRPVARPRTGDVSARFQKRWRGGTAQAMDLWQRRAEQGIQIAVECFGDMGA